MIWIYYYYYYFFCFVLFLLAMDDNNIFFFGRVPIIKIYIYKKRFIKQNLLIIITITLFKIQKHLSKFNYPRSILTAVAVATPPIPTAAAMAIMTTSHLPPATPTSLTHPLSLAIIPNANTSM